MGRLTPSTGLPGDGVALAQVIEQRRQGRQLAPDGAGFELAAFEIPAPGDDMHAANGAQFGGGFEAGESVKLRSVDLVGAAGFALVMLARTPWGWPLSRSTLLLVSRQFLRQKISAFL
jgi:hypothetical protein